MSVAPDFSGATLFFMSDETAGQTRGGAGSLSQSGLLGLAGGEVAADTILEEFQRDDVAPALGNDDVGVLFTWLDERLVHGLDRREILLETDSSVRRRLFTSRLTRRRIRISASVSTYNLISM